MTPYRIYSQWGVLLPDRGSPEYNVSTVLKEAEMNTMTIRVSDEGVTPVYKLTNFEGVTISDFTHIAILEKIGDSYDLHELQAAVAADDGRRLSIDEILEELRRCRLLLADTASNSCLESAGGLRKRIDLASTSSSNRLKIISVPIPILEYLVKSSLPTTLVNGDTELALTGFSHSFAMTPSRLKSSQLVDTTESIRPDA